MWATLSRMEQSVSKYDRTTVVGRGRVRSDPQGGSVLTIDGRRLGPVMVLTTVGEIDISSAHDLQRALDAARDGGAGEIWLDLTRTTFIDCRGLHALLDLRASLLEADRRLVLIRPAGPVRRLLALAGADREFETHCTAPAAIPTSGLGMTGDTR